MQQIIPEYIEGWNGLRDFLLSIGIKYARYDALSRAWRSYGIPFRKSYPCAFDRHGIAQFVYRKTGFSFRRWMEQREEDEQAKRPSIQTAGGRGILSRGSALKEWPIWVATRRIRKAPWILRRDDGFTFVTRSVHEAETWDTSEIPGDVQIWRMRRCMMAHGENVHLASKIVKKVKQFSVWAPMVYGERGLTLATVPPALVGSSCKEETTAAVTAAVDPAIRKQFSDFVSQADGMLIQWIRWYSPVELDPVTLEPKERYIPSPAEVARAIIEEDGMLPDCEL